MLDKICHYDNDHDSNDDDELLLDYDAIITMQQRLGCSTQVVAITAWSLPANLPSLTYLRGGDGGHGHQAHGHQDHGHQHALSHISAGWT